MYAYFLVIHICHSHNSLVIGPITFVTNNPIELSVFESIQFLLYIVSITPNFYAIIWMSIPPIPIAKHNGENNLESHFPNSVFLTLLKNPTYLNSPIALMTNIIGMIHPPYFITHSGSS